MAEAFERALQDLRYAARTLRRSLGFTVVVLVALALGIGATTTIFTVVKSVLLERLPFPNPDRLVSLREITPRGHLNPAVQTQNFLDWRSRSRSFEQVAAFQRIPINLVAEGDAEQVEGLLVSSDFFPLLGVQPLLGRWLTAEDDRPGATIRVILSFGYWQRRFGGDTLITSRRLTVSGSPAEVVGVMPAGFNLPGIAAGLFVAARINPAFAPRDGRNYQVYGRMREGVPIIAAEAEMRGLAIQTATERPEMNARWSATAIPLLSDAVRDVRTALLVLFGAVLFLLILCCVNVANLYLMRTYDRARELALRHALGANRGRLIHQLVFESLLLTLTGGALGILLAHTGVRTLLAVLPSTFPLPRLAQIHVDGPVLLVCLAISVLAGLVFGLAPAFTANLINPADSLRQAGHGIAGRRGLLGNALVVAEVALALVLVCGAGLMARSFVELSRTDPGFRADHLLTIRMLLVPAKYGPDLNARAAVVEQMLERIRALPQVTAAASIHLLPLSGIGSGSGVSRADRPAPAPGTGTGAGFSVISNGYFHAMGIPLLAGREFEERDRMGAPMVAIINQTAARMLYQTEDPIGKELMVDWTGPPKAQIIGVAADSRFEGMEPAPDPVIFLPNAQRPSLFCGFVIRTSDDPVRMIAAAREAMRGVDPQQGVLKTSTMEQRIANSVARPRLQTILLDHLGFWRCCWHASEFMGSWPTRSRSAALNGCASGARRNPWRDHQAGSEWRTAAYLLRCHPRRPCGTCSHAISGVIAIWVRPTDPAVFALAIATLVLVACIACYVPARRAARVDPIAALREE